MRDIQNAERIGRRVVHMCKIHEGCKRGSSNVAMEYKPRLKHDVLTVKIVATLRRDREQMHPGIVPCIENVQEKRSSRRMGRREASEDA